MAGPIDPVGGTVEQVLGGLGDDLTAKGMVIAMSRICTDMTERFGWDCNPELWSIERTLPPPELAERIRDDLHGEAMMLQATPMGIADNLPDGIDGSGLAYVITMLAEEIARDPAGAASAMGHTDVVAWLLSHEAWRITGEEARVYNRSEDDRPLKDMATSQEMRILVAVDRVGYLYLVQQIRGQEELEIVVDRHKVLTGNLPDALRALTESLPPPAT